MRYEYLESNDLTHHHFDQRVESGYYERISPGLFLRAGITDDTTAALMAIATKRPSATICLLSALTLHDLTDEIPQRTNIAIPRGTASLSISRAPISWHRFDADTFQVGRCQHQLPTGLTIGLYSAERTIIDLFRLRHNWGSDLAIAALRAWLRQRSGTPASLLAVADRFPKARPALLGALEVLL